LVLRATNRRLSRKERHCHENTVQSLKIAPDLKVLLSYAWRGDEEQYLETTQDQHG